MNEGNNLFYVCSLIEYIGRERKLRRADVAAGLGESVIRRIFKYADTFHCEQIAKVADDFITMCNLPTFVPIRCSRILGHRSRLCATDRGC